MWLRLPCINMAVKIVSTAWKLPVPLKNAVRCAGVNAQALMNASPSTISSRKTKTFSPMMVRLATAGRLIGCSLATGKSAIRFAPSTKTTLATDGHGSALAGHRRCRSSVIVLLLGAVLRGVRLRSVPGLELGARVLEGAGGLGLKTAGDRIGLALSLEPHGARSRCPREACCARAGQFLGLALDRAGGARAGGEIHRRGERLFHLVLFVPC